MYATKHTSFFILGGFGHSPLCAISSQNTMQKVPKRGVQLGTLGGELLCFLPFPRSCLVGVDRSVMLYLIDNKPFRWIEFA